MPRKLRPHRTPSKPSVEKIRNEDQNRFVFTVDPQCIITFPIDHCLYVCDICSSVLKTQDLFKKHYIKLHINHAHTTLSDLKFCEAFPINVSKFKEDEGCYRCHFCVGLFFKDKTDLKLHLNQHGPLQEIPEEHHSLLKNDMKPAHEENNMADTLTENEMSSHSKFSNKVCVSCEQDVSIQPEIANVLSELLPPPDPNIATACEVTNISLEPSSATETPESTTSVGNTEPLSDLIGSSLLALFNASPSVVPDSPVQFRKSSLSKVRRCSSSLFAQDCNVSNKSYIELTGNSSMPTVPPMALIESVHLQYRFCALAALSQRGPSLPETVLPVRANSSSSVSSSSSGFSSASTEDLLHPEENDVIDRSEESFSSIASSNSDEESVKCDTSDVVFDNIRLSCLFCDMIFANIKSTRSHMLKCHHSKLHWECVFCKSNFKNCDFLLHHLCSNHSDIYFACISCKIRFDSKAAMDRHIQNEHNSENLTNIFNKMSELNNKGDLIHQLKCIPYYTNQNGDSNLLGKHIKLSTPDKISSSDKLSSERQVTNQSIQVSEEEISLLGQKESQVPSYPNGSILKRKLLEPTVATLPQSKIIKMSKHFNQIPMENSFQSMLPVVFPCVPPIVESGQEIIVDKCPDVDKFPPDEDCPEKYLHGTNIKLESDPNYTLKKILCLFCTKINFSVKGNNTHVAKVHRMRRGGKFCCFCNTNFRTLDLLFSHLCSNHAQEYFACVFCKDRFDSNSSLLSHFGAFHDGVNVNKETMSEYECTPEENLKTELFMRQLKCVPIDPSKVTPCVLDLKMPSSANNEDLCMENNTLYELRDKLKRNIISEDEQIVKMNAVAKCLSAANRPAVQYDHQEVNKAMSIRMESSLETSLVESPDKDSSPPVISNKLDTIVKEVTPEATITEEESSVVETVVTKPLVTIGMYEELKLELVCLFCERTFDKAKAFRVHLFRSHKAKKNKCLFCPDLFNYYEDLFVHLLESHSDHYFACGVCKLRHTTKELLNEHMVKFHTPEENIKDEPNHPASNCKILQVPMETVQDCSKPICVPEEISINEINYLLGVKLAQNKTNDTMIITSSPSTDISAVNDVVELPSSKNVERERMNEYEQADAENATNLSLENLKENQTDCVIKNVSGLMNDCCNEVKWKNEPLSFDLSINSALNKNVSTAEKSESNVFTKDDVQRHSVEARASSDISNKVDSINNNRNTNAPATPNLNASCENLSNGMSPRMDFSMNTSSKENREEFPRPQQLISFRHPKYDNIVTRDYSQLEIMVQLQVLERLHEVDSKVPQNPEAMLFSLRPQRQQRITSVINGKREFSGEWARARNYFCANCASHFVNFWDFDVHRWNAHPDVACAVFDFYVEDTPPCYFENGSWPYNRVPKSRQDSVKKSPSNQLVCTKCSKISVNTASFHRHLMTCAQQHKVQSKLKRSVNWKEIAEPTNKLSKRKRRSSRGVKSILDTPPKLSPTNVFKTSCSPRRNLRVRMKADNVKKSLLVVKPKRRLSLNKPGDGDSVLTRSQAVISDIDEKTKELIEQFERGKYSHTNTECFTRRLIKSKPKDCS